MDGRLCAVYRYGRLSGKIYESGGPGEYHPVAGKKQQGKLSGPGGKKPVPGAAPAGKKGRDAPAGKKRKGFPFFMRRYRHRLGLLAGIALFFATIWFLSLHVWVINVSGNDEITEEQVISVMDEIGIRPGVRTSGLDAELLEQAAMVKLKDVSWMAINFQGSVVNVELKERDAPPEAIPMEEPCNLKSSYPGQIVRLEVISGVTVVEEGDAVTQGQLLVSGVFEDLLEGKAITSTPAAR